MSKFVDEIIKSIHEQKDTWVKCYKGRIIAFGITNGIVRISDFGNPGFVPVISLFIGEDEIPITYFDSIRLHSAVKWWLKNVSLFRITQNKNFGI